MVRKLRVKNLTVFPDAQLDFGPGVNVIVGENGTGKTHLLKMVYSVLAVGHEEGGKHKSVSPSKAVLQRSLADKLVGVFRPEYLGRLARRVQGQKRCEVSLGFKKKTCDIDFYFATTSKSEVSVQAVPQDWIKKSPAYFPTRELLSIFPNFVSVYEGHYLEFEETWRDTCLLLGLPMQRGPKERRIRELLEPLEEAMEGKIELDRNGRFYLRSSSGRMEIPLVAEGLRKLGMLARLISTGTLLDHGYLFWDEPDANLNPRLVRRVAKTILDLGQSGIQVFIATHSLFLLRELEILDSRPAGGAASFRFFGLHRQANGVEVLQGDGVEDIGDIASLDEELEQSDRFLQVSERHS